MTGTSRRSKGAVERSSKNRDAVKKMSAENRITWRRGGNILEETSLRVVLIRTEKGNSKEKREESNLSDLKERNLNRRRDHRKEICDRRGKKETVSCGCVTY